MDLSKTLLIAIDVFFFLLILVLLITSGVMFYAIFISEVPFYVETLELSEVDIFNNGLTFISGIAQLVYVAILFYFRKGIKGMVKESFFHDEVAKNLNITGVLLALVSIGSILINFIALLFDGLFKLELETSLLQSDVFMVIMGLFLMLMARVIKEGLALKSENELTI